MKILGKIISVTENIKYSMKRFPVTILVSVILTGSLIYLREANISLGEKEILKRVNLILGLGIPLSLNIKLVIENLDNEKKSMKYGLNLVGLILLIAYYYIFVKDYEIVSMSRYSGSMIFLILAFFYIPKIKNYKDFEYYTMDIYYGIAITFIYSLVLYLGIVAILLTINGLFDVNIEGKFFYYVFLLVSLIFGVSLFASKVPAIDKKYEKVQYPPALKILLLYIIIPLISIYTLILYIYFGKILLTRIWPKGLVSHLVIWYSTISVGVIFLITPILRENKLAQIFKLWFPKLILPILLMMFISISKRVGQYGITENRYYLMALGLWISGIMIYFSSKKPLKNIIIPISLSIIILNSIFGPLSSFAVAKSSQNKRLGKILKDNNMVEEGTIIPNSNIDPKDKEEINNIITYFNSNHNLEDIEFLPKGIEIEGVSELTGFKYESYHAYSIGDRRYLNYSIDNQNKITEIKDYDYYIDVNTFRDLAIELENLVLTYDKDEHTLTVLEDGKLLERINIVDYVKDIHEKQTIPGRPNQGVLNMDSEGMTYKAIINQGKDTINLKFIFNNIYGEIENEEILLKNINFILLIKKS